MSSAYVIFLFILVLYCLPFYLFLSPGLVGYIFAENDGAQKGLQVLAFILMPLLPPFVLAWWSLIVVFVFVFMLVAYPIYWLRIYFPFGGVFRAWYRLSSRLLALARKKLTILLLPSFSDTRDDGSAVVARNPSTLEMTVNRS